MRKILFLFIVLTGISWTLFAQFTIPVDTSGIWYTNKQDLNSLRCFIHEEKLKKDILICYSEMHSCRNDKLLAVEIIDDQRVLIDGYETQIPKIKNQRNIAIGVGGALALVVIALGIK